MDFTLTPSAQARLNALAQADATKTHFRVSVLSGGCKGFQYIFNWEAPATDDIQIPYTHFSLIIDPVSEPFLMGCTLNYVEEMIGSYFAVTNPQAKNACGCGNSFSV